MMFGLRLKMCGPATQLSVKAAMPHETTLVYSEQIIRQAALGFLRHTLGIRYMLSLGVVALSFGWCVVQGMDTWLAGMFGAILFMGIACAVALYFVHYRASLRKFRQMGSPQATFRIDESTLSFTSAIGTTTLQWSVVKELWQLSSVWLLLYSKAQYNILPLDCLPPEMQTCIEQCVQSAGGKILGKT